MAKCDMIVRSISDEFLSSFMSDFECVFERVRRERGELDLRLRDNYFNLYHRGNSLAKVEMKPGGTYPVTIHRVFANGIFSAARFGTPRVRDEYLVFSVPVKLLHSFFSKKNIDCLMSRIAERDFGEEITFEQMLITDNMNREDFHIIDRQVCGGALGPKKMDALGLEQVRCGEAKYRMVLLEAKLGNNPELAGEVGDQLDHYLTVMNGNFNQFKHCYERTYAQMRRTGVFTSPSFDAIEIVPPVEGYVVVGGYSGIGREAIAALKKQHPNIKVCEMFHLWKCSQNAG